MSSRTVSIAAGVLIAALLMFDVHDAREAAYAQTLHEELDPDLTEQVLTLTSSQVMRPTPVPTVAPVADSAPPKATRTVESDPKASAKASKPAAKAKSAKKSKAAKPKTAAPKTAKKTAKTKAPDATKPKALAKAKPTKYSGPPVGGYFIYTASQPDTTITTLKNIKATGADTAITFGSRLRPTKVKKHTPQTENFRTCTVNGKGCLSRLKGLKSVKGHFTYEDRGSWDARAFSCKQDQRVRADNGDVFTLLVLPTSGSCTKGVDVVVTKDSPVAQDANTVLIDAAQDLDMKVFIGMPAPQQNSSLAWLPDLSYSKALNLFTSRFLTNYKVQHGAKAALNGFYHHVEMPVSTSGTWNGVRALYASQNALIHKVLPGKSALISPYFDARRASASRTKLNQVDAATSLLLDTANGTHLILAPQDGQGTGKVGAFTPAMANHPVDSPSSPITGSGTYGQLYEGSTGDYMKQVVKGARGHRNVHVWANLELMTATTRNAPTCVGATGGRGEATVGRVLRQSRIATPAGVSKTIGFMWTPYATCGSKPIGQGLADLR